VLDPARRILVIGASRGIGRALAEGFARPGRELVLIARRLEALADVAQACTDAGAEVCTLSCDVARVDAIEQMLRIVVADGVPDMIVNCAGVMGEEVPPWEADPQKWWTTQRVNLRAPFLIARGIVPGMLRKGGGRILDLSSGAAVTDTSVASDYWVSKTALFRLGSSWHRAGYDKGLRVLELAPGVVATDMTRAMKMHQGRTEWTDIADVVEIAGAFADGLLDGISGTQVRAGTDRLADLIERSRTGVATDARRLRLTDW
jgi:NAD(P)-dependent dehydrogenase (short-subunit alcohol dehydrogenase family)